MTDAQVTNWQDFRDFIDAEVIIKAKTLGVKTGELKVHTLQRQHGVSQVRPVAILEFLKNMVYYKLRK